MGDGTSEPYSEIKMLFRRPNSDEMDELGEKLKNSPEAVDYWNNHFKIEYNRLVDDTMMRAELLKRVLPEVRMKFPNSLVLRKMLYLYAEKLERIATFQLEGADPLVISDIFLAAANLYQEADEMAGFLTDYAIRQQ